MSKNKSAEERARAIEWLREIEDAAADLVAVGDLLFRGGVPVVIANGARELHQAVERYPAS